MSDEYASSGYQGSLVNDSANQNNRSQDLNYSTHNYPPSNDSTASGGYGSSVNTWSDASQRGRNTASGGTNNPDTGLVDQSLNGGPIGNEIQDAMQGQDRGTRREFEQESRRDFDGGAPGLNPYGRNPDSKEEARDLLASKFNEGKHLQYESGAVASEQGNSGVNQYD